MSNCEHTWSKWSRYEQYRPLVIPTDEELVTLEPIYTRRIRTCGKCGGRETEESRFT